MKLNKWSELEYYVLKKGFNEYGFDPVKINEKYFSSNYVVKRSKFSILIKLFEIKLIDEEQFKIKKKEFEQINTAKRNKGWDAIRKKALVRDSNKCYLCKSKNKLEVHHIIPHAKVKEHKLDNLITLCQECHSKLTHGSKRKQNDLFLHNYSEILNKNFNLKTSVKLCKNCYSYHVEIQQPNRVLEPDFKFTGKHLEVLVILMKYNSLTRKEFQEHSDMLNYIPSYELKFLESHNLIISKKLNQDPKKYFISSLGLYILYKVKKISENYYGLSLLKLISKIGGIGKIFIYFNENEYGLFKKNFTF